MSPLEELADSLAQLPLRGIQLEYPNVLVHVLNGPEDIKSPRELHPAFYGCFDWHSSVHGHWMLVRLLKQTHLKKAEQVRRTLGENLTEAHLKGEAEYFQQPGRRSFERMYGWTWLLKLVHELRTWDDQDGKAWAEALQPLEEQIVRGYLDFLPRQTYPVRLGTHTNTAFGLMFAYDYACEFNAELKELIESRALDYFAADKDYPLSIEPSGADFLSPSLTEADLMRRVLDAADFARWFQIFAPGIYEALFLIGRTLKSPTWTA
jgi:hypothetical protein